MAAATRTTLPPPWWSRKWCYVAVAFTAVISYASVGSHYEMGRDRVMAVFKAAVGMAVVLLIGRIGPDALLEGTVEETDPGRRSRRPARTTSPVLMVAAHLLRDGDAQRRRGPRLPQRPRPCRSFSRTTLTWLTKRSVSRYSRRCLLERRRRHRTLNLLPRARSSGLRHRNMLHLA